MNSGINQTLNLCNSIHKNTIIKSQYLNPERKQETVLKTVLKTVLDKTNFSG